MHREERELDAIGDSQLVEDAREVPFYRVLGNGEPLRDLLVGERGGHGSEDLTLTLRQTKAAAVNLVRRTLRSKQYGPDGVEQRGRAKALVDQVTDAKETKRLMIGLMTFVPQHRDRGSGGDFPQHIASGESRTGQVEDHEIRPQL